MAINVEIFKEEPNSGFNELQAAVHQWAIKNANYIKILSAQYGVYEDDTEKFKDTVDWRRQVYIRYEGKARYTNPQTCKHEDLIYQYNNDATCTEDGTEDEICDGCGYAVSTRIKTGSALGHNYPENWTTTQEATCLDDGLQIKKCTRCDNEISEAIPALGHIYPSEWTISKEATCEEDGIKIKICTRCGEDQITDTISKLGHNYPDEWTVETEPTCETEGLKIKKCSRCDSTINEIISKLGHSYPDDWTIVTPASCEVEGLKKKKCIRCDNEITEVIPALEHTWSDNGDGTHTCITEGGCGTTEECSPSDPGTTCEKCGYEFEDVELAITTTSIDGMVIDTEYTKQLEKNIDKSAKWSISSGSLPDGISLSEDGIISGTPTTSGIYTFIVKCVCGTQEATKEYSTSIAKRIFTVTFNAMDGECSETTRQIADGSTIGELPTASMDGMVFGGWFTAETLGMQVDAQYTVTADVTLYARYGEDSGIVFGDATTTFNIAYNNDRTNYQNQPYTLYSRNHDGTTSSNIVFQTGIACADGTGSNNLSADNDEVTLYIKVTNNGTANSFDFGFDCDSYINTDEDHLDNVMITRLENGVQLSDKIQVTVPYTMTAWIGKYNSRTSNRYNDVAVGYSAGYGSTAGDMDTGYALTMYDLFINSGAYIILEVTFKYIGTGTTDSSSSGSDTGNKS